MERRELLGILGTGAAGILGAGAAMAHQGKPATPQRDHDGHAGQHVLDECARVCNETIALCLGRHEQSDATSSDAAHLKAIAAMLDCQEFCELTSGLMARKSPMLAYAHQACAQACRDCAAACEQARGEAMKQCAEVCHRCEQHCKEQSSKSSASGR
ncbi:MAG: hypothetical protein U0800_02360 [Isosphaeraceae bacterium]